MAKKSICPQCGMEQDGITKFCSACGSSVNIVDVPEAVTEVPEAAAEPVNYIPPTSEPANNFTGPINPQMNNSYADPINTIPPTDNFGQIPPTGGYMGSDFGQIPPLGGYVNPNQPQESGAANGCAVAGMIIGILSILVCCFNWLDIIVGIVGLVLSIVGLKSHKYKGLAVAGLICSIAGILLAGFVLIAALASGDVSDAFDYYYDFDF